MSMPRSPACRSGALPGRRLRRGRHAAHDDDAACAGGAAVGSVRRCRRRCPARSGSRPWGGLRASSQSAHAHPDQGVPHRDQNLVASTAGGAGRSSTARIWPTMRTANRRRAGALYAPSCPANHHDASEDECAMMRNARRRTPALACVLLVGCGSLTQLSEVGTRADDDADRGSDQGPVLASGDHADAGPRADTEPPPTAEPGAPSSRGERSDAAIPIVERSRFDGDCRVTALLTLNPGFAFCVTFIVMAGLVRGHQSWLPLRMARTGPAMTVTAGFIQGGSAGRPV